MKKRELKQQIEALRDEVRGLRSRVRELEAAPVHYVHAPVYRYPPTVRPYWSINPYETFCDASDRTTVGASSTAGISFSDVMCRALS